MLAPMSSCRRQVVVDAPVERLWELIGDVNRHPEWWPRVEDVQCELLESGCTYRQVTRRPGKTITSTFSIECLDDCRELRVRCLDTGMFAGFLLSAAQDATFVDAELGMDPIQTLDRITDPIVGRPYMRRWLEQSLDGLRRAACSAGGVDQEPGGESREPAAT